MPIQILPPAVANQIAAGEVVERPSSAVKELIENSLDASATEIRVEIREGGRRLIRVQDDGRGIPSADTAFLFQRHATSKIARTADLDRLTTLGFRGEALASIGSVAQVTLVTCARGETTGTLVRVSGGEEIGREAKGGPPGTAVTVEHLFANVPARLKFLKQAATEAGHVLAIVTRYALAYPDRRFSLVNDGKLIFQSSGSGKLYDAVVKVYGLDMARQMLPLAGEEHHDRGEDAGGFGQGAEDEDIGGLLDASGAGGAGPGLRVSVRGYVGVPSLHRSNRTYISMFVNGRWFQDASLAYGVIQAYHTLLPVGRYPVALIFIEMEPGEVDVNVHPAKAEVRFRDSHAVFSAVQRAVRATLTEHAPIPAVTIDGGPAGPAAEPLPSQLSWDDAAAWASRRQALLAAGTGGFTPPTTPEVERDAGQWSVPAGRLSPQQSEATPRKIPILRVVGQLAGTYIVAEGPDGLYLIDQHAAHERILYEQLSAAKAVQQVPVQPLLAPLALELSPEQASAAGQELETLRELGVDLEPFGGNAYLLRAVPAVLSRDDPQSAVSEIIDGLADRKNTVAGAREAQLITLICKRPAVKGGLVLSMPEMQEMVRLLEACLSPRTCPHGRPTMVHVSAGELARQFGRT